ncbi:MAG TPA: ferritin-like domain-containing protein [Rubrobacteraceae bacterium]|nr:ferritin-like domain-containing protein [Rubrobacteraceae bacterium]
MNGSESRTSPVGIDQGHSRRDFLKTAAWATAAISAAGIGGFGVASRFANAAHENYPTYQGLGDAAIFSFALQLERLEGTFYARGVEAGLFSGPALTQIAAIRDHEMAHVDAITTTLSGAGAPIPPAPNFTFPPGVFENKGAFLQLAATFEPVGIGAYGGAAAALESKELLAAALSIHNVECQHRVAINILNGVQPPNNLAFEPSLPLPAVQQAVAPFGITG